MATPSATAAGIGQRPRTLAGGTARSGGGRKMSELVGARRRTCGHSHQPTRHPTPCSHRPLISQPPRAHSSFAGLLRVVVQRRALTSLLRRWRDLPSLPLSFSLAHSVACSLALALAPSQTGNGSGGAEAAAHAAPAPLSPREQREQLPIQPEN